MPGNPVLDLNTRPYRALGTIVADARALTREWGLVEPAEATLYLTAAWIAWRHAALLGPRAPDARCYRFVAFFCGMLALGEGLARSCEPPHRPRRRRRRLPGLLPRSAQGGVALPLVRDPARPLGAARPRHGLVSRPSHGRLRRREIFDPTTLLLYAALVAQAVAQTLDVDDTLLSTRHPFFRDPLEEPFELLAELLLVSGLLLKYCRDWRRAGRPQM